MDIQVTRRLLGRAGEQRMLSAGAIRIALDVSGLRPGVAEAREFAARAMQFGGILSLAAGIIFLIAFNWQQLGLYGRFAMVELPLLIALAVAWMKGVDALSGKLALLLAILLTGALLALFGQTYQTGADVYELFLGWAVLALPWVVACRYAPTWALWLLLLNLAALLYAMSARPGGLLFWLFWAHSGLTPWILPFVLNVVAYVALEALAGRKAWGFGPRWLGRGAVAVAMAFGTFIVIVRILDSYRYTTARSQLPAILFVAVSIALAAYAYRRREDLFVFAVLALAWVAATTTLLGRVLLEGRAGPGGLFLIAIYVIAASSGAVAGISRIGRLWKSQEAAQ